MAAPEGFEGTFVAVSSVPALPAYCATTNYGTTYYGTVLTVATFVSHYLRTVPLLTMALLTMALYLLWRASCLTTCVLCHY